MNKDEIDLIKKLDPEQINGTIQSVLLRDDLHKLVFKEVLYYLLKTTLSEKEFYMKDNEKLANILKKHKLYTSETLFNDTEKPK
jgi:Mn-containing catalase